MSQSDKIDRTPEDQARAVELHDKSREDLLKRQLSNNENYDKAILSLSSAGLALSLTAIKFVIPLSGAIDIWALKMSWVLFLATIILSLSAYLIGNKAISKQLEIQQDYYIKRLLKAQNEKNKYSTINSYFNIITGLIFACAISLVIYFVIVNLHGDTPMTTPKIPSTTKTFVTDSASVPQMQLAPGSISKAALSADIPSMQLAPSTTPVAKQAAPSGGNESTQEKSVE